MRRDHLDAPGHGQSGCVGIDHERRKPLGARAFARAREYHVMAGDAAVRDPGLAAVDAQVRRPVGLRRRRQRCNVGAGFRLRQREGGDGAAVAHRRQVARLELGRAEQRDRTRAQALHGEGEVGEPVAERENFPGEAERAHVEARMKPAMLGRHHRLEEARRGQRFDARPAGRVDILVRQRGQRGVGPAREGLREAAMAVVEKRPAQGLVEAHLNCPRTPASAWRRRRGMRAQSPPFPCTAPAPPPRLRSRSRPTSPTPFRACAWSSHWRK